MVVVVVGGTGACVTDDSVRVVVVEVTSGSEEHAPRLRADTAQTASRMILVFM